MALALQAFYQARKDANTEGVYITQLRADLDANVSALQQAIGEENARLAANGSMIASLYQRQPLSPDSASRWLHWQLGYYTDPRPVLATVTTLIETGDIKLIRDAALRSHIVAYASLMTTDLEEVARNVTRLTGANDAERRQWEKLNIPPLVNPRSTAATAARLPGKYADDEVASFMPSYLKAWPILRADGELRAAYQVRLIALANRVFYLERMLKSTEELRALLK